ncbi:MAG: B12-binding domain-containing radical SAM protein [Candidatus Aminicenantia bacterium]
MKKKVLLLHCPEDKVYLHDYYTSYSSKANYYWSPSDLIILSGILREYNLLVIDAIAERLSPEECERKVLDFNPDAIIFTTGSATLENDVAFLKNLRNKISSLIIGSSSIFQFEGEYFLKSYPVIDALILDIISPEVVDFIEGKEKEYHTIGYRKGNNLYISSGFKREQNFHISIPRHELFKFWLNRSPLAKRTPFAIVITSLGCPFTCEFCVAGSMNYQYRNIDNVIQELKHLQALGVKEIMFNDPTFTVSKKRTSELCQKMMDNGLDFTWLCNAHVSNIDEDLISKMSEAGCHTLMIGVESGTDEILEKYSKKTTRDKIKNAFKICKKYKVKTLAYFIIGLPGETRESILETISFAKELDCDFASFTVITPDIGSKLRQEAIEKGWLDPGIRIFDSTSFPVFSSGELTKNEIWKLRQKAIRSFYLRPSYLIKKLKSVRSFKEFTFLVEQALTMFSRQ